MLEDKIKIFFLFIPITWFQAHELFIIFKLYPVVSFLYNTILIIPSNTVRRFFEHADTAPDCGAIRGGSTGYYDKVCLQTQQQTRDDFTISVVHGDTNLPSSHLLSVEQNYPGALHSHPHRNFCLVSDRFSHQFWEILFRVSSFWDGNIRRRRHKTLEKDRWIMQVRVVILTGFWLSDFADISVSTKVTR